MSHLKLVLGLLVAFSAGFAWANSEHGNLKPHQNVFPPKMSSKENTQMPGKIELTEPAALSKISGTSTVLKWKELQGADRYHVQVATDPNFKWLVLNDTNVKETQLEVGQLESAKHYFWRVSGLRSNNEAGYLKGYFSTSSFETP